MIKKTDESIMQNFLESSIALFRYYKMLGEKAIAQVSDTALFWQSNEDSNSIATIVKHLSGNMLSRWTDFLATDGEKESRDRDIEFENDIITRKEVLEIWERGWSCLFSALENLKPNDFNKIIYIRNQGHTVLEAINRQSAHYPYHIGQIVFIAKMKSEKEWQSLSVARNQSKNYNSEKFSQPKNRGHFTDDSLKTKPEK